MRYKIFLLLFFFFIAISESFSSGIQHAKNIPYSNQTNGRSNLLDIYYEKSETPKKVLVFIHGGSWNSGKKETYWWLGRNFAHKNVVSVIINYSLSPAKYEQMATDCAAALKWVKQNISGYGGDPERIFVMGHSAGGHLAELINLDPRFFQEQNIINPIRGVILDDPFGLDMFEYMTTAEKDHYYNSFIKTFSTDEQIWKKASPLTYISYVANSHLIFIGARTYPSIMLQSNRLYDLLKTMNYPAELYKAKRKRHVAMISQMIFRNNRLYSLILDFMKGH
jgi:acetyl esterase/lipase